VAETLDGEATIVDLDSGTYYALNESGSFIWDALIAGTDTEDLVDRLASTYEIASTEAADAVDQLIAGLREQNLVVPSDEAFAGESSANGASANSNGSRRYIAPELSTYTDMQELLLLDPIHEVDESGWPSQA
jgi:hypothetical protein